MHLHFLCTYYSQWAHENLAPRTQGQWDSFKFCRAVKSRRINGTLTFPWKEKPETISAANVGRARQIFGRFIKLTLERLQIDDAVLIPIPSKDGLIHARSFRSLEMLTESAGGGRVNATISPVIRFSEPLKQAHARGPRGRGQIYPYLRVIDKPPPGTIILVDDLVTTGGSLLAASDRLVESGFQPSAAISCGLTVSDSLLAPFGSHSRKIDRHPDDVDF